MLAHQRIRFLKKKMKTLIKVNLKETASVKEEITKNTKIVQLNQQIYALQCSETWETFLKRQERNLKTPQQVFTKAGCMEILKQMWEIEKPGLKETAHLNLKIAQNQLWLSYNLPSVPSYPMREKQIENDWGKVLSIGEELCRKGEILDKKIKKLLSVYQQEEARLEKILEDAFKSLSTGEK